MEIKILIIGIVIKDNQVLMRKKPANSPPYKETWYLFGGELTSGISPEEAIQKQLEKQAGIKIEFTETLSWDTEIKKDHDGIEKQFVYLDCLCNYVSGNLKPSGDIEKLDWVEKENLKDFDIVPPSRILFHKLGWL